MKAIVSVSDKSGVNEFTRGLADLGYDVYSTGGTKKGLIGAGIRVKSISELTGFPEILDGRVKTLHPAVHGGILARRDLPQHMDELKKQGFDTIDLVAVNLYPFVQTVAKPDVKLQDALENIDIGGPTLIRASAKNFPAVVVVVDPADYEPVLKALRGGGLSLEQRRKLARKAFQHVATYDTAIAQYLGSGDLFPEEVTLALHKVSQLRYGENPHQQAAFYTERVAGQARRTLATLKQLHGPELSFNNLMDLDAAAAVVCDFSGPAVSVIKHTNPCGLSTHADLPEAYRRALSGDPLAAYGGVIGINRPVTLALAEEIAKNHYDAMIAPEFLIGALELLNKKKNFRITAWPDMLAGEPGVTAMDIRRVTGGLLFQTRDSFGEAEFKPRVVTKRAPTDSEMKDLYFAWRAVKSVKSNAIVVARDATLLGMGAGQPSRVVSVQIALERAGERGRGSVLGSDAFFPFPDGVENAAKGGVTAIMQPGGSIRDADAIAMADKYNLAMVFTGVRHFRH
jgi:phosphoribosylaminoimidazolecarboxamide formyltransferase/IMP cyclohydrolase